ncbi:hypothetical protein MNBD_ALPHA09-1891 [hydrothermal vent metagenome]|uniref:Uncharacterized protein n=1 Tax=hydrothermal vent metagenome TaxID=652676 RepID=A0A3B0TZ91_9ZZZZ
MSGTTSGVVFSRSGDDTNMRIFRGKTLNFEIIWGGSAPIDITGYQASLQARDAAGDLMLDLSTGNGGIVIDGPTGKLSFTAAPAITDQVIKAGRYEVEMTTAGGDVYRVISGGISPVAEVVQ